MNKRYLRNSPVTKPQISNFVYEFNGLQLQNFFSDSSNSHKVILNQNIQLALTEDVFFFINLKDVLVYYYAKFCGQCKMYNYRLLLLKQYLGKVKTFNIIKIDVSNNDLDWHLTSDTVPKLILFPAYDRQNSLVYNEKDSQVFLNEENLLDFILTNSNNVNTIKNFIGLNYNKSIIPNINKKLRHLKENSKKQANFSDSINEKANFLSGFLL